MKDSDHMVNYVITNWNTIVSKLTTVAGIIKNIDDQSQIASYLDSKQSTNQYHIGIRTALGEGQPSSINALASF